jgi:ankyrin repeat protein
VRLLLEHHAQLDVVDIDGNTPLHHCASIGHTGELMFYF